MKEIQKLLLWTCITMTVAMAQKITATNFWVGAVAYLLPAGILFAFFDLKKDKPERELEPAPKGFHPKIIEVKGSEMPEELRGILKSFLNSDEHKDHEHAVHKIALKTCDDPDCKNCKGTQKKK